MVLCLGEPSGGFCDVGCYSSFLAVFVMLAVVIFLFPGTLPWLLGPVKASTSSELYPGYFPLLYFSVTFSPRPLRFWVGIFFAQAFFTLPSFPTFGTTCFYQGFPGSPQFFLEGCRASHWGLKHRPGPSVCFNQTAFSKKVLVSRCYLRATTGRPMKNLPLTGFELFLRQVIVAEASCFNRSATDPYSLW